jgi:hypothetical protein
MKTNVKLSLRNFISVGILGNIGQLIRLRVGRYAAQAIQEYELYVQSGKSLNGGRLSETEITALRQSEEERLSDAHYRQQYLKLQISEAGLQQPERADHYHQAALSCLSLLQNKALDIRSMANVGARMDVVCSYLAPRFPDVQFTSVDFPSNLAEMNRDLRQSPNWSCVSGYGLDLFERQDVTADLVLFSFTCELMRNQEVHEYLAALATFAKYVVLVEQWWPIRQLSSLLRVVRPEEIDPDRSHTAGRAGAYLHNYPAMLERSGFEVLSSEIVEAHRRGFWTVKVVARKRGDER